MILSHALRAVQKTSASSISFVSSSYRNNTSSDSVTVTAPSGIEDGDLLVAYGFTSDTSTTITPPSGWTLQGDAEHSFVASKVASSESGNYTFTWANTAFNVCIAICVYRGASNISIGSFETYGSGSTSTVPSITASAGAIVACFGIDGSRTTSSTITDFTRRVTTSNPSSVAIYDYLNSPSGSTGTKSITWNSSANHSSVLINLY